MDFVVQIQLVMEEEVWKDVVGYEGLYVVNNAGVVKSLDKCRTKKYSNGNIAVMIFCGRVLSPKVEKSGYITHTLTKDGVRKTVKVHRLVATAFIPNPENKPQVNHINGIKSDNHVQNLEWATTFENRQHAYDIGLQKPTSGIKNGMCTHTEDEIKFILKMYASGMRQIDIVNEHGFKKELVNIVVNGKAWKHIKLTSEDYE